METITLASEGRLYNGLEDPHVQKKEYITSNLTSNSPTNTSRFADQRKITVVNENRSNNGTTNKNDDIFDIPLLSQVVNMTNEKDLEDVERKIRNVKSRLGLLVDSDLEEELPEIKREEDAQEYRNRMNSKNSNDRENKPDVENCMNKMKETSANVSEGGTVTVSQGNTEHKRITFESENPPRKLSVLQRLGDKTSDNSKTARVKNKISLSEFRREEEPFLRYSSENRNEERRRDLKGRKEHRKEKSRRDVSTRRDSLDRKRRDRSRDRRRDTSTEAISITRKEGILNRLGVKSKISVPQREVVEPEPEDELKTRDVRSMVQVKPRVIPSGASQPSKNLLLKAVAEAQRSVAQAAHMGTYMKSTLINTETANESGMKPTEGIHVRKFSEREKNKLKKLILNQDKFNSNENDDKDEEEYIPKPIKETLMETPKYVPSTRVENSKEGKEEMKQQFIITLDGIEKKIGSIEPKLSIIDRLEPKLTSTDGKLPVKSRLDNKKSPSPIIFDKVSTKIHSKANVPDRLPIVHPPLSIKNKERCKYWPNCRQGDKCEFVHPSSPCEIFPNCKFGDKCLYLHPTCKFNSSCTKRDCPYSHMLISKSISRSATSGVSINMSNSGLQTCKFFPNCTNSNCPFYHPKPCKFGRYCKNQSECSFSHQFISNKSSLIWRCK
ncbi:hypothetical protein NQ315_002051 [Exocentrus adspersus]|uniref:Zinc finger CCCH domain-containing protein 14 n=1 Tax=Exocentrus adspersus TaxID=1586481 RepID=A0AAV8VFX4_9CUCU|nr:hypothetical protein NQ315_002051 [Exocentrus adspersus]